MKNLLHKIKSLFRRKPMIVIVIRETIFVKNGIGIYAGQVCSQYFDCPQMKFEKGLN